MLEKIDIHLVDHCNLKCKSCTHFSSLADEFFLDVDEFERDLSRLSYLTQGKIKQIYLLGGEPLLHEKVCEFFPIARNLFRNSQLIMITNAILLNDKDENFWKALRRSSVEVWISKYVLNLDYPSIEQKARAHGVKLFYTSVATNDKNEKSWMKFTLDIEGKQYWLDSFKHCSIKNCVTLKHGKLYTCPTIAHIEHFNKHFNLNMETTEYDYVDIYKAQSYDEILSAMVKPAPFCKYCKTRQLEKSVWAVTKKELSEWT